MPRDIMILHKCNKNYDAMFGCRVMAWDEWWKDRGKKWQRWCPT